MLTNGKNFFALKKPSIFARLARFLAGLNQAEALLDLPKHACEISAVLFGKAGQDLLLPSQQARNEFLVQRRPLPRQPQLECAAIVRILDAFHKLAVHQRGHGTADGGFVGSGAMRDILRAARFVSEAERCQHPPFRSVEPVSLSVLTGKRRRDLRGQPVQPERRELEQVQGGFIGRVFLARSVTSFVAKGCWHKSLQFELTARAGALDSCRCDYLAMMKALCQNNLSA